MEIKKMVKIRNEGIVESKKDELLGKLEQYI
jgi:hypothetical protein